MNLKHLLASIGILTAGFMVSTSSAQAFSFTTNLAPGSAAPRGDIFLDSVKLNDGSVIKNFSTVQRANILQNDSYTGGNTGAASSDRGDNASGVKAELATNTSVAASLGNLNLNNIIDGEDQGSFKINLSFEKAVSNLFFWERGMNSKLGVQAIDAAGNLIGRFMELNSSTWQYAGYNIDTTEIGGEQRVGSLGVSLADLGVAGPISGIQVSANASYNGPDFKVIGGSAEAVPEPTTMAGLALGGAGLAAARRRKMKQA